MGSRGPAAKIRSGTGRRALAVLLVCGLFCPALAQAADVPAEYSVKAAFLLNFTRFVTWPPDSFPDPKSPLAICVLGRDPFGRVLDAVAQGETANGHGLVIRRISEPPAPQACQILFLNPEIKDARKILNGIPSTTLTVGEGAQFVRDGGMIGFVVENRRVRFDINQTRSDEAGLKLSSRLLSVARAVVK